MEIGWAKLEKLSRTYSDVKTGEMLALVGSSGRIEIAVREGNAADRLALKQIRGTPVKVRAATASMYGNLIALDADPGDALTPELLVVGMIAVPVATLLYCLRRGQRPTLRSVLFSLPVALVGAVGPPVLIIMSVRQHHPPVLL